MSEQEKLRMVRKLTEAICILSADYCNGSKRVLATGNIDYVLHCLCGECTCPVHGASTEEEIEVPE